MSDLREALAALDAEIARRRSPDYQWFPKPNANQTPDGRAGAAGARGMQHGELTGLVIARELIDAALSEATTSPEATLDVAWREAEAALPEGWHIANLVTDGPRNPGWWVEARAGMLRRASDVTATGPTPTAALLALAVRLRGPA